MNRTVTRTADTNPTRTELADERKAERGTAVDLPDLPR
jgi:hypothetical protein